MNNSKAMLDSLEQSLAMLQNRSMEVKEHYLTMLIMLTDSFLDESRTQCLLVHKEGDRVAVCASNATEEDCIDMIQQSLAGMLFRATKHAPPRELFH